jgi:hypothetical protein
VTSTCRNEGEFQLLRLMQLEHIDFLLLLVTLPFTFLVVPPFTFYEIVTESALRHYAF